MIQCAIIGLGRIGSLLEKDTKREKPATHAGAIDQHPDCHICAGCDTDAEKRQLFQQDWNCTAVYSDYTTLLSNHTIDILHVATPPETHRSVVESALAQQIPVIILEKPVAHSIIEARAIEHIAANSSSRIIINHERRYALQYQYCKDIISDKTHGDLLSISAKLYMGRNRALKEILYDDGTHMIDLIHYLTDGVCTIEHAFRSAGEHQLFVSGTSGNTPILFEAGRLRDHLVFELDLSFTRGRITVGNGYFNEYAAQPSPYYEGFRSLITTGRQFPKSRYFSRMFEDAVHCYRTPSAIPLSSLADGIQALTSIERML